MKSKADEISPDNFIAFRINTQGWKFNREEVNERHSGQ
jgi:hypothetical protein